MARKSSKRPASPAPDLYESLRSLLEELERPAAPRKKGPGRPEKNRADTSPVILHLYTSQIQWLDRYADRIQSLRSDNARLSRVEIVRGLLLGLAQHAMENDLSLPLDNPIRSERDLQHAIALTLGGHG